MLALIAPKSKLISLVKSVCRVSSTEDAGIDLGNLAKDQHFTQTGVVHFQYTQSEENLYCIGLTSDAPPSSAHLQGLAAARAVILLLSVEDGLQRAEVDLLRVLALRGDAPLIHVLADNPTGDDDLTELALAELEDLPEFAVAGSWETSLEHLSRYAGDEQHSCDQCSALEECLAAATRSWPSPQRIAGPPLLLPSIVYEKVTVTAKGRHAQPVPFGLLTQGKLSEGAKLVCIGGALDGASVRVESVQIFGRTVREVEGPAFISVLLDSLKPRDVAAQAVLGAEHAGAKSDFDLACEKGATTDWLAHHELTVVTPAWSARPIRIEALDDSTLRASFAPSLYPVSPFLGMVRDGPVLIASIQGG